MPAQAPGATTWPLQLGPFELDVTGSTPHDADDTWDASWLAATARCTATGATVSVPDVVLTSWSVRRFAEGLDQLVRSQEGCALLASEGPKLSVCARPGTARGSLAVRVDITPTHDSQGHWFAYDIDGARVPAAIAQCRAILTAFPAREVAES